MNIIKYFDKLVNRISNFSFVADQLNMHLMKEYAANLFELSLNLFKEGLNHCKFEDFQPASSKFKSAICIVQELLYESALGNLVSNKDKSSKDSGESYAKEESKVDVKVN